MKPQMINAKMNKLDLRSRLVKAAMFAATIFMVVRSTSRIGSTLRITALQENS